MESGLGGFHSDYGQPYGKPRNGTASKDEDELWDLIHCDFCYSSQAIAYLIDKEDQMPNIIVIRSLRHSASYAEAASRSALIVARGGRMHANALGCNEGSKFL